jgi:hypothetical protein
MLCIGVLFGETLRPGLPKLAVRAKLGGKVLGFVDMPAGDLFTKDPLCTVEKLQSQASKLFVHPHLPARYLMVFVDQVCLTRPSFAFTKQLGFKLDQARQEASRLLKSKTIDVMYNEWYAMKALEARNVNTMVVERRQGGHHLTVTEKHREASPHQEPLLPELEVFGLAKRIEYIDFMTFGARLDRLASFVHLKALCITTCGDAYLKRSDFQNLSQSRISTLILYYTGFAPLKGISLMVNLTTLVVCCHCSGLRGDGSWYTIPNLHDTQVPREIGLLRNLKKLIIRGAYDDLPLEITNLQQHGTQVDVDPC